MHVDEIVTSLRTSEQALADALVFVADRHVEEPEVRDVGRMVAAWSAEHADALDPFQKKYGSSSTSSSERLRAALFHGSSKGGIGLVQDLHDLAILTQHVALLWMTLGQVARGIDDRELQEVCKRASAETERQSKWLSSMLKLISPQAIGITADRRERFASASVRTPVGAKLTDALRKPAVAIALVAVVGTGALLAGLIRRGRVR